MVSLAALIIFLFAGQVRAEDQPDDAAKYGRKLNDEERLQALDLFVEKMKENYEKIHTWKGEYRFEQRHYWGSEDKNFDPIKRKFRPVPAGTPPQLNRGDIATGPDAGGGYWTFTRGTIHFGFDRQKGKYHAFYDPHEDEGGLDVETGTEGFSRPPAYLATHYVVNPDFGIIQHSGNRAQLKEFPPVKSVPREGGRLFYRRRPEAMNDGRFVDLRGFFFSGEGYPPWTDCEFTVEGLRGKRGEQYQKRLKETYAIYVNAELPPVYTVIQRTPEVVSIAVYDGKTAYYPTLRTITTKNHRDELRLTCHAISGVFVPKTFQHILSNPADERDVPRVHWSFESLSAKINEEIPEKEISVEQFDFQYGERMLDQKEKKLYVYDGERGFVPAEEFQFDPNRVKK